MNQVTDEPTVTAYADLEVGQELGRLHCETGAERVQRYRQSMPDSTPADEVPLLMLATMHAMKRLVTVPDGTVHAEDTIELRRPVKIGEPVETVLSVEDKFPRGERRFVVLRQELRTSAGEVVLVARRRLAWAR
jgi:hypothetical protein